MPKWGLTADQRQTRPWGIEPSLLEPAKTITEPVHEDVYLTRLEALLVDSPPMQRLRRVRQLGTTDLVYPGATHSRFAHSIGTLRAAQDLLDAVLDHRNGPRPKGQPPRRDLFEEWAANQDAEQLNRRIAEATVLARLAALLHDICHVPFGHSIEDDLGILKAHDANIDRFDVLWATVPEETRNEIPEGLLKAVAAIVLSKAFAKQPENPRFDLPDDYTFVADIVGNTICADLLDYLARDHYFTGLPSKLGHRFIDGFYVTPSDDLFYPRRMAILIRRGTRIRADIVSELFKFLRYRYELSERVLVHHTKLSADAMIGKALEIWYDSIRAQLLAESDGSDPQTVNLDTATDPAASNRVSDQARLRVEEEMLRRGDEGILEHLASAGDAGVDRRLVAVSSLASAVLERRLYKLAARSDAATRAMSDEIHRRFGGFDDRRKIEERCARYAGLEHRWHVLVWLPGPNMRLKAADVLVDDGEHVQPLRAYDLATGKRGAEITDAHRALWAVSVYVHPSVPESREKVIVAWLAKELGVAWASPAPGSAGDPLVRLAVLEVARDRGLSTQQIERLSVDLAASGGASSFADLVQAVAAAADGLVETEGAPGRKPRGRSKGPEHDTLNLN